LLGGGKHDVDAKLRSVAIAMARRVRAEASKMT